MKSNSRVDEISIQDLTIEEVEAVRGGFKLGGLGTCMILGAAGGIMAGLGPAGVAGVLLVLVEANDHGCFG